MAGAEEDLEWTDEARAIAASAAALVREFIEEDITHYERLILPPASLASGGSSGNTSDNTSDCASSAIPNVASSGGAQAKPAARTRATPVESPSAAVPWGTDRPTLAQVEQHLGDCTRCGLSETRSKIVFGYGNPDARMMFIGEGPGEQEDKQGLPFVGRAGDLLTDMIEKGLGIPRSEVYICNIVKCRPPQNRTPLVDEVSACRPFLDGQIRAVAPKVIITLGKPAAGLLLGRDVAITRLRGTWQDYQGIPLMPTLHPAYVLRQYTPENRRAVWEDLKAAYERSQT